MKHEKILACFFLTFSFLLTGCSTKDQSQSLSMTGTYFDTVVKIEVWGADSEIMDGCKDICEKYEQLLSPTIRIPVKSVRSIRHKVPPFLYRKKLLI